MNSPWNMDNNDAFDAFYDQSIAIVGKKQSITVKACIFENDFDDPLSELTPSTDRKYIQIFIPKYNDGGWNFEPAPKCGDILTVTSWGGLDGISKFAIETVHDFMDSWRISAREVK